jgi:phage-related protein (TIGR01555 family)
MIKRKMKIRCETGEVKQVFNAMEKSAPPPGVIPENIRLAMDSAMSGRFDYAEVNGAFLEGQGFLGFPYLAELAQRPEYRKISGTIANEMTRCWITITAVGDDELSDKTDTIAAIEKEFKRLRVQDVMRKAILHDGFFGRGQIFIDMGVTNKPEELKQPLRRTKNKIGIGKLRALVNVEPMWSYPNAYNSTNPLKNDYFIPTTWFVMGTEVHASRFLFIRSREVPDLLKPVYVFGGLSLSQMCKPYVDNWLRTRQSVSDLIHSFSVSGLKTNLGSILDGGAAAEMHNRVDLFNMARDNKGMMVLDKDTEEFFNITTPLSTLDQLQAQAQEQMSSVASIPLVKLLGITPSGLNASSDGEVRVFYDWIMAEQEANLTTPIEHLLEMVQLSLFGSIDPDITFRFNPLWSLDETQLAEKRKSEADTDSVYINAGVLSPEEVRVRLATEENTMYQSLDLDNDAADLPDDDDDLPVLKSSSSVD